MAQYIEEAIKYLKLNSLDTNQSLVFVQEKTKVRPSQIAFGVIVLVTIILIIFQASTLLTCLGCFLVPAYFSFLSLEQSNHQKDVKYLTYWVVFTVTEILAFIFQWLIGCTLYAVIRVALTAALLHPKLQLSTKIYYNFISPYVMKFQQTIDQKAQAVINKGKQAIDELTQKTKQQIQELKKTQ